MFRIKEPNEKQGWNSMTQEVTVSGECLFLRELNCLQHVLVSMLGVVIALKGALEKEYCPGSAQAGFPH